MHAYAIKKLKSECIVYACINNATIHINCIIIYNTYTYIYIYIYNMYNLTKSILLYMLGSILHA